MTSLMETFDAMEEGQLPESMKLNLSDTFKVQCFFWFVFGFPSKTLSTVCS